MSTQNLPKIAWTLGDAAGIGPELIAKSLANPMLMAICQPVVVGPAWLLDLGMKTAQVNQAVTVCKPSEIDSVSEGSIPVVDLGWPCEYIPLGAVSASAGKLSLAMLQCAVEMAQAGIVDAVVKAPSNKEALKLGGNPFDTELPLVAGWLEETEFAEVNVVGDLFTSRVTSHVPLKDVASLLQPDRICETIQLLHRVLTQAGYKTPAIGVSALNPHAGEHGLFGDEESEVIAPGIALAQKAGIAVEGPLPADTIFVRARRGDFQGVVTMFHDQGLIAMKLLGFDRGVSVSGGLSIPIMTTSHGTAFDIAGQGLADPGAFQATVELAVRMAVQRGA